MAYDKNAWRKASPERARELDREAYARNRDAILARKKAALELKRAEAKGMTLDEYRAAMARKKAGAIDKKLQAAFRRAVKVHKKALPDEVIEPPKPAKAKPTKRRSRSDATSGAWDEEFIDDDEAWNPLQSLWSNTIGVFNKRQWRSVFWLEAALDPTGPARAAEWKRSLDQWVANLHAETQAKAKAEREAREKVHNEALLGVYRQDYRKGRYAAWPELDADTYATGRFLGDILETGEGRPISLEHQAMRTEKAILSCADIKRLRELGDPEVLRIDEEQRQRNLRDLGYPTFGEYLTARWASQALKADQTETQPAALASR